MGRHLALGEDDVLRASMPAARKAAATSRVWLRSSAGSCHVVMACRSTMQKMQSYSLLQPHPVADGAEIVAEVQVAGRLDAGEDAASWRWS